MADPKIEIVGVYRLRVTEELFREQFRILYDYPMAKADRQKVEHDLRKQLASIVLIEAIVRNRDQMFDVGHFTQPKESEEESNWQTAWAEAYLTPDGKSLAVDRWDDPPDTDELRVAFFMHEWQTGKPIRSSYGIVDCPPEQDMPERLVRLVPYEPID
jgi:hypothetical protein